MKWRLLAAFTGLLAMVLIAQDVPLASYLRRIEKDRLLASLERDAFVIAGASENVLSAESPDGDQVDLHETARAYASRPPGLGRVVIMDAAGLVIAASDEGVAVGDQFANPNRPEVASALAGTPTTGERDSVKAQGRIVYVAVPVLSGADVVGAVRITYPASVIDDQAAKKTKGLFVVFVISLVGAAISALVLANSVSAPLRRLRRSTEVLAAGDFSVRAATNEGPPEVRSLAKSFNTMTERIATLMSRQKAFTGDASHQLRTPLTALRLQLERAGALVDHDPEAARERIEAASAETERLQRLVDGLLMIARSDAAMPPTERVDVSALVLERAEVWGPLAAERGITLAVVAESGIAAKAVRNWCEQILDNYVDNALNAAPDNSEIQIHAIRTPTEISLLVIDQGRGIPPEHVERAFDRFWRAPDSLHDGSGIGLSVVQHLASLSGGRVNLHNRSDGPGLVASVTFPAWGSD